MASDSASEVPLSLTCHGGVGEIGGNKFLLETPDSSLLLDFGMSFGAEGQFFEEYLQPGLNSKLLDLLELDLVSAIDGTYRYDALRPDGLQDLQDYPTRSMWGMDIQSYEEADNEGDWTPDGIFISHAHMDHVAYLPYLGDVPIVMSPTTETLVSAIGEVGNFAGFDDEFLHIERRQLDQSASRAYFP